MQADPAARDGRAGAAPLPLPRLRLGPALRPGDDRDCVCAHCGHAEPIPDAARPLPELDLRAVTEASLPASALEETRVATCPSCGALIEYDAAIHAKECPFCASPIVSDTGVQRQIKPQAQLPFLLGEAEARQAMAKWLGRLWFAPNDLQRYARADRALTGVYAPYWTYDAETRTEYAGPARHGPLRDPAGADGGQRPAADDGAAGGARRLASGAADGCARDFDDVLVMGSKSLPKRYTDALAPWDLSALSPYDPRYPGRASAPRATPSASRTATARPRA